MTTVNNNETQNQLNFLLADDKRRMLMYFKDELRNIENNLQKLDNLDQALVNLNDMVKIMQYLVEQAKQQQS